MPVVPFDRRAPKAKVQSDVSQADYLMAAANMEQMGLLRPAQPEPEKKPDGPLHT